MELLLDQYFCFLSEKVNVLLVKTRQSSIFLLIYIFLIMFGKNKLKPLRKHLNGCLKEVLMTKNGPIDFAQSWAAYKKNPIRFMAKRKWGVAPHF
jgi:hypothetical protein